MTRHTNVRLSAGEDGPLRKSRPPVSSKDTCLFVVPVWNEGGKIGTVITEIIDSGYSVLVVDDGSTDNTYFEAIDSGARVVRHGLNLGQGAALQTGFDVAQSGDRAALVTFDSDGQHRLADAISMVDPWQKSQVDVIFGSRFLSSNQGIPRG